MIVADLDGDREYTARLHDIAEAAADVRPAMRLLAGDFERIQQERFERGGGWQPLTRKYAEAKRAAGRGTAILELAGGAGGRLRRSLTEPNAPYAIRDVQRGGARFGTSLGIAGEHQGGGDVQIPAGTRKDGASRPARTVRLPARPLVDDRVVDAIAGLGAERVADHLGGGRLRGSGVLP